MTIGTPVSIGSNQVKAAGTTISLTTTAAVPAGALLCVLVDTNASATATFSDGVNSFTVRSFDDTANVWASFGFKANAAALSSGSTITATLSASTTPKGITAFYIEGVDATAPFDESFDATATGSTTAISVTSAAANAQAHSVIVALVAANGSNAAAYTNDANYAAPPDKNGSSGGLANSNAYVAGGYRLVTSSASQSYAATQGNTRPWVAALYAFSAAPASLTGARTIAAFASTAAADVLVKLSAAKTLAAIVASGTLSSANRLIGAGAIAAVTASGTLAVRVALTGVKTLAAVVSAAAAAVLVKLTGARTISNFTSAGAAAVTVVLSGSGTVGNITSAGQLTDGAAPIAVNTDWLPSARQRGRR